MTKRKQVSMKSYVRIRDRMLMSPARRVLSRAARQILDGIEIELLRHGGKDNGALIVTYENFKQYGVHHNAIGPGLREVEVLGFIEITQRGFAGNADERQPHRYRLTYLPTDDGKGPTDEWQHVKDMKQAKAFAAKARAETPKGYPRLPRNGIIRNAIIRNTCQACGVEFKPKRNDARFCSKACKQMHFRENVTDNSQYRKTRKPIPETGTENDHVSIPETGTEDPKSPIPETGTTI